jgi:bifunctional UDP-N-acetylglucosamine pyrophosphorylase/glucosamine-1-phosphate N-acetyltransferase
VEGSVPIGEGARIASGVVIKGASKIGKNTVLYPHVYIENSIIGDNCTVLPGCIVNDSTLENNVQIGPYTHLRNSALVREGAKMGNFVEMKKSTLGKGSKAMHLSYIGDAEVGEKVNIGAGTITCNYDGVNKNKTVIEDNVFIGSGTELVAPVTIRKNSYVAAGSTITEEVPEDSLGVARQKQRNVIDWVKRKRKKG